MARTVALVALVAAMAGGAAAGPSACDLLSPCPLDTVCRDLPEPAGGWSVGEPTFVCELQRVLCGPDYHFDHTHKICVTDAFCPCTSPNSPCHGGDGTCQPMTGNSCDAGTTFCTAECTCGPEAPCFHQMACFPLVGGSCSPGTEFCPNACSTDPCPEGQVEIVPCSLDGDRVCGTPDVPPEQQENGDGDCLICAGETAGPCKHLDGTCTDYHTGTTLCPTGTFACAAPVGISSAYDGEGACGGCWPLTGGPCQAEDTVCWMADAVTGQCPPGTSSCSLVGSLEAEPTVVAEIVLSGDTPASQITPTQRQLLKESIADKLTVPPTHLVITRITDAPASRRMAGKNGKRGKNGKGKAGRKLAGHTLVVEVTIVTPRESNPAALPGLSQASAKQRLVAAVESNALAEAVAGAGLSASVSVDTNAINVDLLNGQQSGSSSGTGAGGASSGTGAGSSGSSSTNEVSILPADSNTGSGTTSSGTTGSSSGSGATGSAGSSSASGSSSTGAGQTGTSGESDGGIVTGPTAAGQAAAPDAFVGTSGTDGGGVNVTTIAVGVIAASVIVGAIVLATRRMRGGAERTGKVAPDSVQRINLNADGQLVDSDEDAPKGKAGKAGKGKGKGKSPGRAFVRTGSSSGSNNQKVVPQVSPGSHDADDMVAEDYHSEFTPASFLAGTDSRAPTRAPSFATQSDEDDEGVDRRDARRAVARLSGAGAGGVSGDEVRAAMRAVARGRDRGVSDDEADMDGSDVGATGGAEDGSDSDSGMGGVRRSRRLARKSDGGETREAEAIADDIGASMPGLVED